MECILVEILFSFFLSCKMTKRFFNDMLFGIQGVNPGFTAREEANMLQQQQSNGKIDLKKQQLLACPYLQVDEQIKLLNLQKNCIAKIANLDHLTSLVVLDLCENEIELIQGLDFLVSLRILRLSNNKIRQIKNLDALKQLDILDLNGNQISRIENCKQLTRLRVLNLAFNRIEKCENLRYLHNLAELNLQGNLITTVCDLESLPIQRLILSFNKIRRFDDIRCISKLTSLECLSLEGNPLAFTAAYEQIILSQSQSLNIKPESRPSISMDQRINRAVRAQGSNGNTNNETVVTTTFINRDRRSFDHMALAQQDSMSERSDTENDSVSNSSNANIHKGNTPPIFQRATTNLQSSSLQLQQQKPIGKSIVDANNPLFAENKLNPVVHERTTLAKHLVQSAIDDAFEKEKMIIELARYWPMLRAQLHTDALKNR